MIMVSMEKLEA